MKLTGEVIKVRYVNEENGYSVFDLNTSDGEIKIVGIFDSVNIGESLEVEGEFTYDNKYGEQLNVSSYQKSYLVLLLKLKNIWQVELFLQ